MTGHEQILALRRRGLSPQCVWVSDYPCATAGDGTTVSLSAQDVPEQQDWRFLVGLVALVDGHDAGRVERIATACKAFARRVISNTYQPSGRMDAAGHPCFVAGSINDTEGIFTWQS